VVWLVCRWSFKRTVSIYAITNFNLFDRQFVMDPGLHLDEFLWDFSLKIIPTDKYMKGGKKAVATVSIPCVE